MPEKITKTKEDIEREKIARVFTGKRARVLDRYKSLAGAPAAQEAFKEKLAKSASLILEKRKSRAKIEALTKEATTDPLTGLPNRRHGAELLRQLATSIKRHNATAGRRADEELAFLVIDLDHFKQVNDTYGHKTGDRVLQAVAKAMKDTMRKDSSSIAMRFGGEEFVVAFSVQDKTTAITGQKSTPKEQAMAFASRLHKAIGETGVPVMGPDDSVFTLFKTASIGVSLTPISPQTTLESACNDAFERADAAAYQAKNTGRNRIVMGERAAARPSATQEQKHAKTTITPK